MDELTGEMTSEGLFQPVEEGIPKLNLKVKCDYWKQFAEDRQHLYQLQHGGLGIWPFDGRTLDAGIEKYLAKHPDQRR